MAKGLIGRNEFGAYLSAVQRQTLERLAEIEQEDADRCAGCGGEDCCCCEYYLDRKNLSRIENYDYRRFDGEAGREVWGYVVYSAPLSEKDVSEYELMEGGTVND